MSELEEIKPDVLALLSVIILQNQRIYDALLTLIGQYDADAAYNLIEVHKKLENVGPIPYKVDDD